MGCGPQTRAPADCTGGLRGAGSLWVTSKGLTRKRPASPSLSTSPSPASSEPLLASVGKSFWRKQVSQDNFNSRGLRGGVGGGWLQLPQCNSVS